MFLLVDKPKGMTSHDVVDRLRTITGERRVGHAGTLDPNATGLLILGIGRESTKKLGKISKDTRKTYMAEIVLGEERDTDDSEGKVVLKAKGVLPPGRKEVVKILREFLGEQEQIPPKYSAIKLKGKKAYELARKGMKFTLIPRKVFVHKINLIRYKYPNLEIEVEVSAGTYIRALARDIGRKLGIGAYLSELRRTKIGEYFVEDAVSLEKLTRENWKRFV
ncbi:tRNA pseudouridine(55) synthase TruB [Patescibacteria group bacterium]|nr:tRNA pseudouridine(55) synthase TruB [Patescibacteria group bacterium]